uniref:Large ribosomal subunit protein bL32m n=1 Tax=Hyaloperonospora arabidopsidis (strain Emoy2) TaxID=559515 RepID=M4B4M4_HYAAE
MAATRVREAIQRFLQRTMFPKLQNPVPVLAPLTFSDASSSTLSSNLLNDFIWLAAPKSKVTPSRKRIRNNDLSKRLKNIVHFQVCPLCGAKKLRHRLCISCFKQGKYFV